MSLTPIEENAKKVIELLEISSTLPYIGEAVNQLEHALQAADFAIRKGCSQEVILACLLHDIGHYCCPNETQMKNLNNPNESLGCLNHEKIGANYLRALGFSPNLCTLVESHVDAKRYLQRNPEYFQQLSEASRQTLVYQGGVMSDEDAGNLEKHPLFASIINIRLADDSAKICPSPPSIKGTAYYLPMIIDHLKAQH